MKLLYKSTSKKDYVEIDDQATLIFKILKTNQKVTFKRRRFVFFSIHRNYMEKVRRNDLDNSSIEMTWKFVDINLSA